MSLLQRSPVYFAHHRLNAFTNGDSIWNDLLWRLAPAAILHHISFGVAKGDGLRNK